MPEEDYGMTITFVGGGKDGLSFRMVKNDAGKMVWISDSLPGTFKQVFVPSDFAHPLIVE